MALVRKLFGFFLNKIVAKLVLSHSVLLEQL